MSKKSKLRRAVKHRAKTAPTNIGPHAVPGPETAAIAGKHSQPAQPAKAVETAPVAAEGAKPKHWWNR